jgi:hypothetical protein
MPYAILVITCVVTVGRRRAPLRIIPDRCHLTLLIVIVIVRVRVGQKE